MLNSSDLRFKRFRVIDLTQRLAGELLNLREHCEEHIPEEDRAELARILELEHNSSIESRTLEILRHVMSCRVDVVADAFLRPGYKGKPHGVAQLDEFAQELDARDHQLELRERELERRERELNAGGKPEPPDDESLGTSTHEPVAKLPPVSEAPKAKKRRPLWA